MYIFSVEQMRAVEKEADSRGHSYAAMMQLAGAGLAGRVIDLLQGGNDPFVLGLAGPGNNGGDTLVALTMLAEKGFTTRAFLARRKRDSLVDRFVSAGGALVEDLKSAAQQADVILDGFLGTGARHPLRMDEIYLALKEIGVILNDMEKRPLIVAVDCPSGVDCDSGEAAQVCLHADLTITFAGVKHGLLKLPAFEYAGEIEVVEIGLPADLASLKRVSARAADDHMVSALLPVRRLDSHKGTFGSALIAAGSVQYTGALLLACRAAYRAGAGLVQAAIPASLHAAVSGHVPEAVWIPLPDEAGFISAEGADILSQNMARATSFLAGPGLGSMPSTGVFIENIIERIQLPTVMDADALRHLAAVEGWHRRLRAPAVLTPHPGEMSALTGLSKEEIQADRHTVALKFAEQWGHVVVLKGAFTAVAAPDGRLTVIPVATPALARAGTGDVLAGLIVGLLAQGLAPYDAAVAGAYIHARAGLLAERGMGTPAAVLAGDVLNGVPGVLAALAGGRHKK